MSSSAEMTSLCDDLRDEADDLDRIVAAVPVERWSEPTPAPRWTVHDQIAHLWCFDHRALLSLTDRDAFARDAEWLMANGGAEASVALGRAMSPGELLEAWRSGRRLLLEAARHTDPSARVPWYGPAMSARSCVTARLMETWAHGQDVVDALGAQRAATDRLRHVAHIGVRARPFSYAVRRLEMPTAEVQVVLRAPSGEEWVWGDPPGDESGDRAGDRSGARSGDRVSGDALDFCLVVTQRRHLADTSLVVSGPHAEGWMAIAQAFAGPPGPGREPGQFTRTG